MRSAIRRNHAERITPALGPATDVKENQFRGRLNDLGRRAHARDSSGHAAERRVFVVPVLIQLLNFFPELWFIQWFIRIGSPDESAVALEVQQSAVSGAEICRERILALGERRGCIAVPDSGQIGVPIRGSRISWVSLGRRARRTQAQQRTCEDEDKISLLHRFPPASLMRRWGPGSKS